MLRTPQMMRYIVSKLEKEERPVSEIMIMSKPVPKFKRIFNHWILNKPPKKLSGEFFYVMDLERRHSSIRFCAC